jgi:pSer/pThr/pTyr-binding forkhead associated (FHA) protein
MKARFAAYNGKILESSYPLPEPGTTIGRHADNHICLNDALMSRQHAVVHAKDGMWVIKDLESTNGVVVNGARVKHAVLKSGDQVQIGPFEFVFETIKDDAAWSASRASAPSDNNTTNMLPKNPPPTVHKKLD